MGAVSSSGYSRQYLLQQFYAPLTRVLIGLQPEEIFAGVVNTQRYGMCNLFLPASRPGFPFLSPLLSLFSILSLDLCHHSPLLFCLVACSNAHR